MSMEEKTGHKAGVKKSCLLGCGALIHRQPCLGTACHTVGGDSRTSKGDGARASPRSESGVVPDARNQLRRVC